MNMIVFNGNVKGLPFEKLCEISTSGGFHGFFSSIVLKIFCQWCRIFLGVKYQSPLRNS